MVATPQQPGAFVNRHIGPGDGDVADMLGLLGASSVDELLDQTVPRDIRLNRPLECPPAVSEHELLGELEQIAAKNQLCRSFIGMGYSDCITPKVILRNILQNPGWYTAYTPYQAEISQGRLEALLNFQTMLIDLTGLEVANASLLDEATAAAEAMTMLFSIAEHDRSKSFFVSTTCHPQTIDVLRTRAEPLGIELIVGDHRTWSESRVQPAKAGTPARPIFGAIVQYPATDGAIYDYEAFCDQVHAEGALVVAAADLLSLALLKPPGEWGADVAVGNTQRFGVPLGYGGPHAAYFVTRNEYVRKMPGRLIGVSQDAHGRPALRMALQTREQHIRREKATSNICTAQVLLAVAAGMYAVYHGPRGLRAIAERVHGLAAALANGLRRLGVTIRHPHFFDTICVEAAPSQVASWQAAAQARRMNFRAIDERATGISLDETTRPEDVAEILAVFATNQAACAAASSNEAIPNAFRRTTPYLTHPVFNRYHSETEMLRYIKTLENRDFSLTHGMIPLGSCTMKLNATAEMIPVTWPQFNRLHPFAPVEQAAGYQIIFADLERWLAEITGLPGVSLQPNAGSQGEYAGLLVIRRYHSSRGQGNRDICLIPASAHGTNPASAVMAGCKVVVVACDEQGNIDLADLEAKARQHRDDLAALMVTYPSTYGVFEDQIKRVCSIVHEHGGQVYLDGANMNAQVGLCRPGDFGADVCHLNLHKTFCIPHGGGGPGMGPIAVAEHLVEFLPRHPAASTPHPSPLPQGERGLDQGVGGKNGIGPVSAALWGSASILLISWAYIKMMGTDGLAQASKVAILNANYMAERLHPHYPVLYRGCNGRVGHECIIDPRPLKKSAGIEVEDIAKRLMDYGFHAPTISFPVPGTMMIEPTESESKAELDRFCEAMIAIREEIREIEQGRMPHEDNLLKNAPHTAEVVTASDWTKPYSRERAAFPTAATRRAKFWPAVGRINNVLGDRNLMCACPPMGSYT
ncbi:MAG: aminomethyl-transferring glycine dehydrogenase [Planctomycetes bacterium]|nr:aminomethyl-transferring glycine dehydrogenase [Planctomycetota bacterium]